jgi:NAD(P)-dependent dehydrogenase (short-subunit alcohol dehydrogenase family)
MTANDTKTALITGASRGLGSALACQLSEHGWQVLVDARSVGELDELAGRYGGLTSIPGDLGESAHREALARAVAKLGGLDLLVNNASTLGASPLPVLAHYSIATLLEVIELNVLAPLALTQLVLPQLRSSRGTIVNISSDAAVEAYSGWGGYGSSKACLDQLTAVLAVEEAELAVYAFDPGDMRTEMHQLAFPGEDISDRPEPQVAAAALERLITARPASGRYRIGDFQ